jgi:aspartate carbamoyltransferase regulatory subunit
MSVKTKMGKDPGCYGCSNTKCIFSGPIMSPSEAKERLKERRPLYKCNYYAVTTTKEEVSSS